MDAKITQLRRQLKDNPNDPHLLLNLSAWLRRAGAFGESSQLLIRCGRIYKDEGEPERARACLHQLLRFDPDNTKALTLLKRWAPKIREPPH